ncbi:UNVERIFIED_CONTAM: hypothetical protein Sradi_3997100 [Sesamum radiatum]|uniref:Uncharacterized protein n=1 Tax=Sesamum radiatum TaxID=300843 RepID=A0AAW2PGY6_SESRA
MGSPADALWPISRTIVATRARAHLALLESPSLGPLATMWITHLTGMFSRLCSSRGTFSLLCSLLEGSTTPCFYGSLNSGSASLFARVDIILKVASLDQPFSLLSQTVTPICIVVIIYVILAEHLHLGSWGTSLEPLGHCRVENQSIAMSILARLVMSGGMMLVVWIKGVKPSFGLSFVHLGGDPFIVHTFITLIAVLYKLGIF